MIIHAIHHAIIANLFEREMVAFAVGVYWIRYEEEENDTELK